MLVPLKSMKSSSAPRVASGVIRSALGSTESERLRRVDRQAAVEHLTAYLAHHLGSPLNVIEGRAAMMASGQIADADVQRNARIIVEQSGRMARFLREVVGFAHAKPSRRTAFDLAELTRAAVSMLAPVAHAHSANIALEDEIPASPIYGDPDTLLVAVTHVVENGILATPEGGTLRIRLRHETRPDVPSGSDGRIVPFVCLEVDDEGPGIDAQVLPKLFKPFTTTRSGGETTGIGLFIAQSIAKDHRGWIEGVNRDEKGARFTLHLPLGHAHAE